MEDKKEERLSSGGWRIGDVPHFLELTAEETDLVERELALSPELRERLSLQGLSSPHTLLESVNAVRAVLGEDQQVAISHMQEEDLIGLHFSVGQWVRNNILYQPTGFARRLEEAAPYLDTDAVSGMIVEAVWVSLRQLPIDVERLVRRHMRFLNDVAVTDVVRALSEPG
jgi:hypothetical protein